MNKTIKNIVYTLLSNLISLIISVLVTFIVPKRLGVENYGYFQLYMLYANFTGFLHLGWADGLFLRYGGEYYSKLNKRKLGGQFWAYAIIEWVLGISVILVGRIVFHGQNRAVVLLFTGVTVLVGLPCTFFQYVLQCTNRMKEYSFTVIITKLVYVCIVIIALFVGTVSYVPIITANVIGITVALVYAAYQCKEILLSRPVDIRETYIEAKANITVGIKLMFANVASMLIIGIVRMSIENQWDVATFGKVSLTMSVSNLLMVFIRAVALVMFPMLRRTNSDKLAGIYNTMRTCLMILLLGMLVFYYPMKAIVSAWLPAYADSLKYMALLFPMCVFESKTSMLIETYMKTLRKEKSLLFVNVATVCLSVLLTGITVYGMHNLDLAIVSIVVLLAFRCVIAELILSGSMEIQVKKDIVLELILTMVFICASWFIGGLTGLTIYAAAYVLYLFIKCHDVLTLIGFVKRRVLARSR